MDWAIHQISSQWAVVISAPAVLFPILVIGLLMGFGWAWLMLNQRLALQKDRAEFYKEKLDNQGKGPKLPSSQNGPTVQHSVIAKKLEGF